MFQRLKKRGRYLIISEKTSIFRAKVFSLVLLRKCRSFLMLEGLPIGFTLVRDDDMPSVGLSAFYFQLGSSMTSARMSERGFTLLFCIQFLKKPRIYYNNL